MDKFMYKKEHTQPPELARPLRYGLTESQEVKTAQQILQAEGFFFGTPLGNFLTLTLEAVKHFQNTHIGPCGHELKVDGVIGPATWWALHNASGAAQRSKIGIPGVKWSQYGDRGRIVAKATALYAEDIKETPNGSNYGGRVTDILNACGFRYGVPWCLAFVSYVYDEALGKGGPLGAMHVHCSTFWNAAQREGRAFTKERYTPRPGDVAIYNFRGGLRRGGVVMGPGHAAIVTRVGHNAERFNAIEGNAGNRVKHSIRRMDEQSLVGFVNVFGDEYSVGGTYPRGIQEAPEFELTVRNSR